MNQETTFHFIKEQLDALRRAILNLSDTKGQKHSVVENFIGIPYTQFSRYFPEHPKKVNHNWSPKVAQSVKEKIGYAEWDRIVAMYPECDPDYRKKHASSQPTQLDRGENQKRILAMPLRGQKPTGRNSTAW